MPNGPFVKDQLRMPRICAYHLCKAISQGPKVWSDVPFSLVNGQPHMVVCCMLSTSGQSEEVLLDVTQAFMSKLLPRAAQIMIGKMLGVMVNKPTFYGGKGQLQRTSKQVQVGLFHQI